ncbi:MAG: dehydrogenase [Candidatus Tectimicrobiota bacterium]|nr:MAG: dehydrogenase [Candidatus Tectomicrobia bacterium]
MPYHVATSFAEMATLLGQAQARFTLLAGGTDLMVARREQLLEAPVLDISRVPELRTIALEDGKLVIGSTVTYRQLLEAPLVQRHCPLLQETARRTGSVQIQNLGTLGGNVVNASPAGDSLTALVALEAEVEVFWQGKRHVKPIGDFVRGPGRVDLPPNGVVTRFFIPLVEAPWGSGFYKLVNRAYPQHPMAIAVVSAAVVVKRAPGENRLLWARVALGAVAPTPVRARESEALLCGQVPEATCVQRAAQAAVQAVSPIDDVRASAAYRRQVTPAVVEKALRAALEACQ